VVRGEGEDAWRTLWILQDQVHSLVALYDVDSEELVESYEYDPLGRPRFFGAAGDGCPESTATARDIGNRMLFTGCRDDLARHRSRPRGAWWSMK
jgi:hypothetical protein